MVAAAAAVVAAVAAVVLGMAVVAVVVAVALLGADSDKPTAKRTRSTFYIANEVALITVPMAVEAVIGAAVAPASSTSENRT